MSVAHVSYGTQFFKKTFKSQVQLLQRSNINCKNRKNRKNRESDHILHHYLLLPDKDRDGATRNTLHVTLKVEINYYLVKIRP